MTKVLADDSISDMLLTGKSGISGLVIGLFNVVCRTNCFMYDYC